MNAQDNKKNMENVEQDNLSRIVNCGETLKHFEPVGLGKMCKYIIKFLKDSSRYGNRAKEFKRYYDLASKYPDNIEEISYVFGDKYINSMVYGFVSSYFLEAIMTEVLTKEEREKAKKILNELKSSGLSLEDYLQCRTEYDSSKDLFEQLSLVDSYIYYEMRKYEIQLKNDEINRSIDTIRKRNNQISRDPRLWLKI